MYCLMLSHAPPQRYNRIRVYETIRRMRKKQGFLRGADFTIAFRPQVRDSRCLTPPVLCSRAKKPNRTLRGKAGITL